MEKSYKFRIYPDKDQERNIQKTFGCTRFIWNYYLAKRKETYELTGEILRSYACSNDLTQLKKELLWLKEVDARALLVAINNLDIAYQNFFRRVKNGEKPGYPKFKSKKNKRKSYTTRFANNNIKLLNTQIQLPKLGLIKCRVSKQLQGRILNATVSQNPSGKYFVSICCTDIEQKAFPKMSSIVGIDLGIKNLCVASNGEVFQNPKYLTKEQKKLAKLQYRLSRKSIGSKNREKARIKVARCYEKITNQRLDYLHKLTTYLVRNYDVICMESLLISNMVKNHKYAKELSDVALGEMARQLEYKTKWYGKRLIKVGRYFPSSQLCSNCGYQNRQVKDTTIRTWTCPKCGTQHDRDKNAANNILNEGMRIINAV